METIHATSVSLEGRALLILGPAGSGKSDLALGMMALGAGLIADDRTVLSVTEGRLFASCPAALAGRIEARGIGILACNPAPPAPVVLAIDLGQDEAERIPAPRKCTYLGCEIALLHKPATGNLPAALRLYLKGGLVE